ncbi:LPXTG cell wall anchor domain-containing protein, partial [Streptomyces sp. NPDC000351]|uniref:LPXTG cell wall anchor domain-containing protein n=2 Tax=unclassified Streptomyces TaxID=2593676 RepID=UPI003333A609
NTEEPGGGNTEEPGGGNTEGPGGNGGGGDNTNPDGGSNDNVAQDEGSSALTDTGEEAQVSDTTAQGSGEELAETGAAQTTFLLVGAATMIAGGIGFRFLPRLMNGRGGAAA